MENITRRNLVAAVAGAGVVAAAGTLVDLDGTMALAEEGAVDDNAQTP